MLLWLDPNIERYANDELFIAFVVKEEMDKFDWDGKFNESKYFEVFFIRNCEYIDDFMMIIMNLYILKKTKVMKLTFYSKIGKIK